MLKEIAVTLQEYLIMGSTDLHREIDGLAEIVQGKLNLDPYSRDSMCANGMKVEEYFTELFRLAPGDVLLPW